MKNSPFNTFLLFHSLFNLLGCCSFKGVLICTILLFTSGHSGGDLNGEAGEGVGMIAGLTEPLMSEAAEFIDDVELLLETVVLSEMEL